MRATLLLILALPSLASAQQMYCPCWGPIPRAPDAYGPGFADMRRRVPDTSKLEALTGWTPTRNLDDILNETIAEATAERQAQLAYPASERF